ncbi:hypothetical protein ATY81_07495 [Rhizobium sp. R72]|nr:hypothetical protein ATY81_07495 [Rhizobium sp. R72]OWV97627.1 hypothetical protein ATY80_07495 [Rhizobium sp. R711]
MVSTNNKPLALHFDRILGADRNGTTSLFAVIGQYYPPHRATESLDILKRIDAEMPKGPDARLVMDKLCDPQDAEDQGLARTPPVTQTTTSWINEVERWFAALTRK